MGGAAAALAATSSRDSWLLLGFQFHGRRISLGTEAQLGFRSSWLLLGFQFHGRRSSSSSRGNELQGLQLDGAARFQLDGARLQLHGSVADDHLRSVEATPVLLVRVDVDDYRRIVIRAFLATFDARPLQRRFGNALWTVLLGRRFCICGGLGSFAVREILMLDL